MNSMMDVKLKLLDALQTYRKQNPLLAHNGDALCRLMTFEVNRLRGREDTTVQDVVKAEDKALGRADYEAKFALYCAELVLR